MPPTFKPQRKMKLRQPADHFTSLAQKEKPFWGLFFLRALVDAVGTKIREYLNGGGNIFIAQLAQY
jgi:hypothetical protein